MSSYHGSYSRLNDWLVEGVLAGIDRTENSIIAFIEGGDLSHEYADLGI